MDSELEVPAAASSCTQLLPITVDTPGELLKSKTKELEKLVEQLKAISREERESLFVLQQLQEGVHKLPNVPASKRG